MDNIESLKTVICMKGFVLTEEQQIAFNELTDSIRIFVVELQEAVSQVFQDVIKPVIEQIKEFMKDKPRLRVKYKLVKLIKPKHYIILNRPVVIHCRNNC